MKLPLTVLCILAPLLMAAHPIHSETRSWMGIRPPASPSGPEPVRPETAPAPRPAKAVTAPKPGKTSPGGPGTFLGTLEGVRCFNCIPDMVILDLTDSASGEAATLSMRLDVWNGIERPVKDRRMFEYGNHCFYFGHKRPDTAFVRSARGEIRIRDVPCYPYLARSARVSEPIALPEPAGPAPSEGASAPPDRAE